MKDGLLIYVCDTQGQAPEWIKMLPLGKVELRDSRAPFKVTPADLETIVQKFRADNVDLVVDYEHQSLGTAKAPAAGWIKDLEARADGLYARIQWTPAALKHIREGEYRYYSPVITLKKPMKLLHAALTNTPAMKGTALTPLLAARLAGEGAGEVEIILRDFTAGERKRAAKEGIAMPDGSFPIATREDLLNAIHDYGRASDQEAAQRHIISRAKALGCMDLLPADWPGSTKKPDGGKAMKNRIIELGLLALKAEATDEEVLAALKANLALAAALPEIAVALGLEKTADAAQIKGTIVALKQGQEQLATLQTEVAALKAESAQGKARMAVDAALAAKKITPAQTEWALSYAARDAEGFKAFVAAAAPVLAPTELKIPANDKEPGGVVDESGLAVCKQMGIDPKDFLANKQQLAAGQ